MTAAGWSKANKADIKFRYETVVRGNRYVGPEAAKDQAWVNRLFDDLQRDWKRDARGYID